jgi:hypothetical protein
MLTAIKDWHQTLSWKLGYRRGRAGLSSKCPWWADKIVFALAFMQGKGIIVDRAVREDRHRA